jgi:hypothetical protein
MAYYSFLKSLRILEEFRKNPHIKILPKSPCTNFQRLCKLKNLILFQKDFSPAFIPVSLAGHQAYVAYVAQPPG